MDRLRGFRHGCQPGARAKALTPDALGNRSRGSAVGRQRQAPGIDAAQRHQPKREAHLVVLEHPHLDLLMLVLLLLGLGVRLLLALLPAAQQAQQDL